MTKLVACVFPSQSAAQAARKDLMYDGFDAAQIQVHGYQGESAAKPGGEVREGDDLGNVVERVFNKLIPDAEETAHYVKAVNNGRCVVALHVPDDEAAERAASILQDAGGTPETQSAAASEAGGPRIYALSHIPTDWGNSNQQ